MLRKRGLAKHTRRILITLATLAVIVGLWAAYMYVVHVRYNGSVENVAFQSGEIKLRGWFIKPKGASPHPTVVILHGAGPCTGDAVPARRRLA